MYLPLKSHSTYSPFKALLAGAFAGQERAHHGLAGDRAE